MILKAPTQSLNKGCFQLAFRRPTSPGKAGRPCFHILVVVPFLLCQLSGCVSDKVAEKGNLDSYQRMLANLGPQQREDTEGNSPVDPSGLLRPVPEPTFSFLQGIEVSSDPNSGKKTLSLSIDKAVVMALANSPEIRVVSFDPAIARQEITKAAADFDFTVFNQLNFEQQDSPTNSAFQSGQAESRSLEAGVKQRGITGAEWSLGYVLTRNWDDLIGRTRPTRYEPILAFQLRQPLLRDGWQEVNLAGVNIARLDHEISLLGFRQKAEDVATQVIAVYWLLLQARRDLEIQESLMARTIETLKKVQGRREIDATDVQIKQAEASMKAREAVLLQARKEVADAQDILVRLIADPQANLLCDFEIVPMTSPHLNVEKLDTSDILRLAMQKNPAVEQARLALKVAEINIRVAENQAMPRLDLVASAKTEGLSRGHGEAQDRMYSGDNLSYEIGLSLEYPIGNRKRTAELLRRKIERRQATASLQNVADKVAVQAKERIRMVETSFAEIQVQKEATEAAQAHLQTLEQVEQVRESLTPEFLLVKLQAQETLAQAQRAEIKAVVDLNTSTSQLAQITGTVLELYPADSAIRAITSSTSLPE
jgi:outer membrane protein TolC